MSDPTLSETDLKNKMALVWTILNSIESYLGIQIDEFWSTELFVAQPEFISPSNSLSYSKDIVNDGKDYVYRLQIEHHLMLQKVFQTGVRKSMFNI